MKPNEIIEKKTYIKNEYKKLILQVRRLKFWLVVDLDRTFRP